MSWNTIVGQTRAKDLLRRAIQNGRVAHAYLFWGPEGVGKDAAAMEFARVLNCESGGGEACGNCASCQIKNPLHHPNISFVCALPTGKNEKAGDNPLEGLSTEKVQEIQEQLTLKGRDPYIRLSIPDAQYIKINSIRKLRKDSSLSIGGSGRRVFIISNADMMNREGETALLKTLEEPVGKSVFIVTTSQKEKLLPTTLSRCQPVQFDPIEEEGIRNFLIERDQADPAQAALAASLANGSIIAAREALSVDADTIRSEVVQFARLVVGARISPLVDHIESVVQKVDRKGADRWLRLLRVWIRDALILRTTGEVVAATDEDREVLERFIKKFPDADLLGASDSVDGAIALVGKNVYLRVIFATLALNLRNQLSPVITPKKPDNA